MLKHVSLSLLLVSQKPLSSLLDAFKYPDFRTGIESARQREVYSAQDAKLATAY